ncbi:MAG: hypothetical protein ACOZBL_04475 [Patescibacteria group bacterium]
MFSSLIPENTQVHIILAQILQYELTQYFSYSQSSSGLIFL